jgi:colanic acid/amylovoran biosynthesis glycosyltransferase
VTPRVAYLVGRYPQVSHTFILREIAALRELGVDVTTFSVWRTPEAELLSDEERREHERTHALLPPRPRATIVSQLRAARAARGYANLVVDAMRLGPPGIRRPLLGGSWILEAATLWHALRPTGVRHIHTHLGGTAPAVALFATALGNAAEPHASVPWTWSLTVHGPDELAHAERERLGAKVEAASFVVAISDFTRSQLMSLVDESHWPKLRVVHCGVDAAVYVPAVRPKAAALRVLCVGRLVSAKGHSVLLDGVARAAREGVRLQLTIVGDGPRRAQLEALAEELGIGHVVTFAGAVAHDRLPEVFAAADVFCLPSFAEGLPVVLMEAMATAIPAVTTNVMGIPELVIDGENGLVVPPGRADLVAQALGRLAGDAELRDRLGRAGRERVMRDFDVRREARRLRDLFAEYAEAA